MPGRCEAPLSWAMSKTMTVIAAGVCAACAGVSAEAGDFASSLQFDGMYTSDFFANRRGGVARGDRHLANLDISAMLDAEHLWGARGLTLFVSGQSNSGGGLSERFVGDTFAVSNIDAPAASRFYEVGADWHFGADAQHAVRVGLLDLNNDFDAVDTRRLYINSALGLGQELGQTGDNGPSTFPTTSLGVRLNWQLAPDWHWLAGAYDGVPGDPDDPTKTTVQLHQSDGLLMISELQREFGGHVELVAFGVWGYTQSHVHLVADGADSTDSAHNHGWYVSTDARLGAMNGARPWRTTFRVAHAEQVLNNHDWSALVALNYDMPRPAGREQSFGIAAAWAKTSSALRSSVDDADDYEAAVELTWRATLTDWLTLQPDVQYIVNPGSQRSIRNAVVVGLRFQIAAPTYSW